MIHEHNGKKYRSVSLNEAGIEWSCDMCAAQWNDGLCISITDCVVDGEYVIWEEVEDEDQND